MENHIVVFQDGETWEALNPSIVVIQLTDKQRDDVCKGTKPRHMELDGVSVEDLLKFYNDVRNILYPENDYDYEWDSDTTQAIADALKRAQQ